EPGGKRRSDVKCYDLFIKPIPQFRHAVAGTRGRAGRTRRATRARSDVARKSAAGDRRAGISAIGIRGGIARRRRTRESRIGLAPKIRALVVPEWARVYICP